MEGRSEEERRGERTLIIIFLQIAELTLREMLENQPLQFEVAMHGQHKTYKFQVCGCESVRLSDSTSCHLSPPTQACSTAIRDMWAQEIRRLLKDQFTLMKGGYSSQHQHRPLFHSPFLLLISFIPPFPLLISSLLLSPFVASSLLSLPLSTVSSSPHFSIDKVIKSGTLNRNTYRGRVKPCKSFTFNFSLYCCLIRRKLVRLSLGVWAIFRVLL